MQNTPTTPTTGAVVMERAYPASLPALAGPEPAAHQILALLAARHTGALCMGQVCAVLGVSMDAWKVMVAQLADSGVRQFDQWLASVDGEA